MGRYSISGGFLQTARTWVNAGVFSASYAYICLFVLAFACLFVCVFVCLFYTQFRRLDIAKGRFIVAA